MSSLLFSLPEIYNSYKRWVSKNPQSVGDWEVTAKWLSYFIAGRINNSQVISELIYCLSNLLVMFNDIVIKKSRQIEMSTSADRIKLWLTIMEYSEVFCELSAQKLWGVTGKWIVIISIQIFKCISRLILIYHYKESVIQNPPIPVLDRKSVKNNSNLTTVGDIAQAQFEAVSFTLKRSGRIVRKVESSPPMSMRTWKPLPPVSNFVSENNQSIEQALTGRQLVAETIYIVKPIMHLASMGCFGTQSWKSWIISLALDITSLKLYKSCKYKNVSALTQQQQLQISKRTLLLILYIVRPPVYEKYSKDKINSLLLGLSKYVLLAGLICKPFAQYLPIWQSTYFYMWSS